jgi:hypothetical protein
MGEKSGSGSRVNNPNHISESLETIFLVKIIKNFLCCGSGIEKFDPGSGMEKICIRDKHLGSATLVFTWVRVCERLLGKAQS